MKQSKGILLDIDGTLVLSNDAHAEVWVDAFAQNGYRISFDQVRPLIGMGSDRILPQLVPGLQKSSEAGSRITQAHNDLFLSKAPHLLPAPGAKALLQRLASEGYKMIAASSANPSQLRALLKAAGVDGLLTEAASTEEVSSSKPAPDIVHAALDKIGLPADRVLMLGDTIYDLQAATESGVKMIALRCGGSKDQALMGAAAIYDHPQDLLNHWKESPLAVL